MAVDWLDPYNVAWTSPSPDAAASMPCGGGDTGLNVWVEDGDVLFYVQRSGSLSENGEYLKLGRVRVRLNPNPFKDAGSFRQELNLRESTVQIDGRYTEAGRERSATVKIWVEVPAPIVHIEIDAE